tara:strand:+ start:975 stop:1256 length:282 start_codon:yes stop_codon:yes gene_type:complete
MTNKSDLIKNTSKRLNLLKKKDSDKGVRQILSFITKSLSQGQRIEIRGFGSFSLRPRKSRIGRNPRTGSSIAIEKKFHPYFRASKDLKGRINN